MGTFLVGATGSKAFRTETRKCGRLTRVSRMNEGSLDANAYVPAEDENALTTKNLEVDHKLLTTRTNGNPITPQPAPELVKCADEKRGV